MVKNRNLTRWVFVLPAIIIVGLLFVYPFFSSIYFSFTNKHLIMPRYKFVGLANYKAVLSDPNFYNAFFNSLKWTVFSLLGQVLVGFVLALALHLSLIHICDQKFDCNAKSLDDVGSDEFAGKLGRSIRKERIFSD